MHSDECNPDLIFFLGAGASIDAGLSGVLQLVDRFKEWLESKSKTDQLNIVVEILSILDMWKKKRHDPSDIDIELLLDAIERIEERDNDLLLYFHKDKTLRLEKCGSYDSISNGKKRLSSELKRFIREVFSETQLKTDYLEPLNGFINEYGVLSVFSTNYDACIEKFSKNNSKKLVDGFSPNWNPIQEFSGPNVHIRLYKLHGSITWYRSEQGDYTRSDIIVDNDKVLLLDGQQMIPLILYPGRKFSYFTPLLHNLSELQEALRTAKYAIVVGYSFKDHYITKIFQDAAKENNELTLLLISPDAASIYQNRLEVVNDPEITHGFTYRGLGEGFDRQLPSSLKGKVILLPYTFKAIFPSIRGYIASLKEAQNMERQLKEGKGPDQNNLVRKQLLKSLIECEHIEKAVEVFSDIESNLISLEEWISTLDIVFQGLLHALASGDEKLISKWKEKFLRLVQFFSIDKFQFVPMIEDKIILEKINNISPIFFATALERAISICGQKESMIGKEKMDRRIERLFLQIQRLRIYLKPWLGGKLTYEQYLINRKENHSIEVQGLKDKIPGYRNRGREDASITEIIKGIERRELESIFGGNSFIVNLDSNS